MEPDDLDWPFSDPYNVAVFASRRIMEGDEWIYYVTHDEEDEAWQFHPKSGPTPEQEARVLSLRDVVEMDPTVKELADLPLGWCAWREEKDSPWKRQENKA